MYHYQLWQVEKTGKTILSVWRTYFSLFALSSISRSLGSYGKEHTVAECAGLNNTGSKLDGRSIDPKTCGSEPVVTSSSGYVFADLFSLFVYL